LTKVQDNYNYATSVGQGHSEL